MADTIRHEYMDTPLRLALIVPGVLHVEKSPAQIDAVKSLRSFKVNTLGPLLLMKHLSPFLPTKSMASFPKTKSPFSHPGDTLDLPSHAIFAMMAARVGSISDNAAGGWYSYRASKAAVFQLAKTFDLHLRSRCAERAIAVAMHPGTVRTSFTEDFWKGREMLEPLESADRLLRFLAQLTADFKGGRGRCWDWKGNEVIP
jgi:NAD(P)-dependent dehydrogenase (short-subunit alcohol dehydrogenase family)